MLKVHFLNEDKSRGDVIEDVKDVIEDVVSE